MFREFRLVIHRQNMLAKKMSFGLSDGLGRMIRVLTKHADKVNRVQ